MSNNVMERALAVENAGLTVVNAVWIATALLHRESPRSDGFLIEEIVKVVREQRLTEAAEDSVWTHVRQHSVANKRPNPNTACVLFDLGDGIRRLYRRGDEIAPGKNAQRTHPEWGELPERFKDLQGWYEEEWVGASGEREDPLLAAAGTWSFGEAEVYVRALREEWEGR